MELARRRRRGSRGSIHLSGYISFICNSGTILLHRSIPILSIVRHSTKLTIHGNSSIARQPVEDKSLLASAIHNQPSLLLVDYAHIVVLVAQPSRQRLIVRPERKYFTILDLSTKTIFRAFRNSQIVSFAEPSYISVHTRRIRRKSISNTSRASFRVGLVFTHRYFFATLSFT